MRHVIEKKPHRVPQEFLIDGLAGFGVKSPLLYSLALGMSSVTHGCRKDTIYTKVDLAALRTLALPWPGGVQ
ncbi:MAG: hypothetical protein GY767_15735 [Shimia sp.]|nr:hypothetical protein [Shimia sp.]